MNSLETNTCWVINICNDHRLDWVIVIVNLRKIRKFMRVPDDCFFVKNFYVFLICNFTCLRIGMFLLLERVCIGFVVLKLKLIDSFITQNSLILMVLLFQTLSFLLASLSLIFMLFLAIWEVLHIFKIWCHFVYFVILTAFFIWIFLIRFCFLLCLLWFIIYHWNIWCLTFIILSLPDLNHFAILIFIY